MFYQGVYSRDCVTEETQNESARMYLSEDENTLNNSDLNAEKTRDVIAELVYSQDRLKKLNMELEHSVELADHQNTALHTENTALSNQVKSLRQALYDSEKLGEELDDIWRLTTEQDSAISSQKNQIRQLEMENKTRKYQNENITSEMSCLLPERAKDKSKMADLSTALQAVQQQMEELQLNLDAKDSVLHEKILIIKHLEKSLAEYFNTVQELRVKIKELEAELEEIHVFGGNNASEMVESLAAAGQHSMSLGDELGLMSHSWIESSDEEEEQIEEVRVVDEKVAISEIIEEKSTVFEGQTKSWWRLRAEDLVKGVQTAGTFTLGFLFPLGVVASMVPMCYDSETGMTCGDVLWTTARYLMEPYSSVHYIGMPPV